MRALHEMRNQHGQKPEQAIPAITEPKYNGIVQEWCAQAGCKTGERAADVFLAVLSHKAGQATSGTTPPMAAASLLMEQLYKLLKPLFWT